MSSGSCRRERTSRLATGAWLVLGCVFSSRAVADADALIREAFEKTKTAASVTDFSSLIELCAQARQGEVSASQEDYLKSLLSWAHNRRGEVYTEQASEAQNQRAADQAARLDGQALADFEMAIQLDGSRWKAWHNRGVSRAVAGKFQEAIGDFSKAIELNAKYANAWFNRGEIHFELDQLEEALGDYSETIRLNPGDAGAHISRGDVLFRLGRHDDALADYSAAIQLAPTDALALTSRSEAYQYLGQWLPAAEDLKRAIDLNPDSPRVWQSAAWLMATCPEDKFRNAKFAVQAAERAVELAAQPDLRQLDTLAAAYANDGRFGEAVARLKEAIPRAAGNEAAAIQRRLQLYQQQQPYRQKQPAQPVSQVAN